MHCEEVAATIYSHVIFKQFSSRTKQIDKMCFAHFNHLKKTMTAPTCGKRRATRTDATKHQNPKQRYVHSHSYIHTYIHIHAYIHIYIHACMHVSLHACMHIYKHTYNHTNNCIMYTHIFETLQSFLALNGLN